MRNYTGNRPSGRRMFRRKGIAPLPKSAAVIVFERALPPERILGRVSYGQTVECRFTRQEPRLTLVIIVRDMAQQIEAASNRSEGSNTVIREIVAVLNP